MYWFSHIGIEMHWVDEIHLWIFVLEVANSRADVDESLTKVLTSMTSYEYQLTFGMNIGNWKMSNLLQAFHIVTGFK